MKIYDYCTGEVVELPDDQYDFMQAVIKSSGRLADARQMYPVTDELMAVWMQDQKFASVLHGHVTILIKARGLGPDYVKAYLLDTLFGKKQPTKEQMHALTVSARILNLGTNPRTSFNGTLTVSPESTTLVFNDGLDKPDDGK